MVSFREHAFAYSPLRRRNVPSEPQWLRRTLTPLERHRKHASSARQCRASGRGPMRRRRPQAVTAAESAARASIAIASSASPSPRAPPAPPAPPPPPAPSATRSMATRTRGDAMRAAASRRRVRSAGVATAPRTTAAAARSAPVAPGSSTTRQSASPPNAAARYGSNEASERNRASHAPTSPSLSPSRRSCSRTASEPLWADVIADSISSAAASAAGAFILRTRASSFLVRMTSLPGDSTATDATSVKGTNRLRTRPRRRTPSEPIDVSCRPKTKTSRYQKRQLAKESARTRRVVTPSCPTSTRARRTDPQRPGQGGKPGRGRESDDALRRITAQGAQQRPGLYVVRGLELDFGEEAAVDIFDSPIVALDPARSDRVSRGDHPIPDDDALRAK